MKERRNTILQIVKSRGSVKVSELSKDLGCSEVTIRNDIRELDMEGLLRRTHGGAVKIEKENIKAYRAESLYRYTDRKRKIAARAYDFINDNDTIIIDDASSSFYLALHIKEHPEKRLAVVTNSLLSGNELAGVDHIELYMVGGHVGGHLAATMGDSAISNIKEFHVDKAFIGVHSINFEAGLTSIATPQMQVKRAILKSAKEVYVLADSSKFGGGYVSVICPITDIHKIITDQEISEENVKKAKEMNVSLIIS